MSDGTQIVSGGAIRRSIGNVGVDSGTMVIAAGVFPDQDEAYGHNWECQEQCANDFVVSSTGIGDGGYDVAIVEDANGPIGLEVVFLIPSVEAEIKRRIDVPEPTEAEWDAFWKRHAEPCDESVYGKVIAYDTRFRAIGDEIWDDLLCLTDPASEAEPRVLGHVNVKGKVEIGDPCYEHPSKEATLPPGRYQAVIWEAEYGEWGRRTYRLGIYRCG